MTDMASELWKMEMIQASWRPNLHFLSKTLIPRCKTDASKRDVFSFFHQKLGDIRKISNLGEDIA